MEAETCVEGPLSGEFTTSEGGGGEVTDVTEVAAPAERMIVTNGDIGGEEAEALAINAGPKVIEVSCESDNVTDTGTDKQKYASKLIEDSKAEEDGSLAKTKHYEESAERAKTDKTDDADISSSSKMTFEENENVKRASDGATLAEYDAKFEEEHQQSVSTVEKSGDSTFTRTKHSSKSVSKSCKRVEELDADGNVIHTDGGSDSGSALSVGSSGIGADVKVGTLIDLSDESSNTANLEEGSGEGKYTRKMENLSKSQRCETTITGGASEEEAMEKFGHLLQTSTGSAASIDLGRLGEIKLSTKVSGAENKSKYALDLDFDIVPPSTHVGESEHVVGKSKMADELDFGNHDNETDRCLLEGSAVSSNVSAHTRSETTSEAYSSESKSSSNKARHYSGEDHSLSSLSSGRHRYHLDDMEDNYSATRCQESPGSAKQAPVRDSTDDLIKRILAESRGETYSSSSESSKKKQKIKIDMGDGETASDDIDSERSFSSFRSAHSSIKEENEPKFSSHGPSDRTVGAERKRTPSESEIEQPSLLERRLGSLGLGKIFQGEESTEQKAGFRASYMSEEGTESLSRKYDDDYRLKGKPKQPDDFDELDQEINALRSTYKDSSAKKYKALYGEEEEEEPVQPRFGRGRMMHRQQYVEEDDYGYHPYEPEPLPDEDFEPQRSEETERYVTEKSAEIRTVVERQSSVLQKLKEASDSFDELQSEIRNIKQQFIENQARRSMVFHDEEEEMDAMGGGGQQEIAYNPYQPSGPGGYVRKYKEDGTRIGGYEYKAPMSLDSDIRSDSLYSGRSSLGLATTASRFSTAYDDEGTSYRSPLSSRRSGYTRSKSLYDNEFEDEESSGYGGLTEGRYGRTAESRYGAGEDAENKYGRSSFQASYLSSSTGDEGGGDDSNLSTGYSRYGSSSSSTSSRLSYTSRFRDKPRFGRSNTLSDFNFDRKPISPSYDTSATSSRFLSKVRERRAAGEEPGSPSKRDKPFKSRFLSKTFDTDSSSSPTSRFGSSRFSSSSYKSSSYSSSKTDSSATDASSATDTGGSTVTAGETTTAAEE